jgi:hypothetical protein
MTAKLFARLAFCLACVIGSDAGAIPSYSGTIQGAFSDPVLTGTYLNQARQRTFLDNTSTAAYSIINGVNAEVISGDTLGGAGAPSTIIFFPKSFSGVAPGQVFDLGTITYFNGSSNLSSLLYGATLTLLVVGQPTISPIVSKMSIVTTQNQ